MEPLNAEHYDLPDVPQCQWWLPAPCMRPRTTRKHLKRFTRLVKLMLMRPLAEEAHVPYKVHTISLCEKLSICRVKSTCFYNVMYDLEPQYHADQDGKAAVCTLKQFAPRGVQLIDSEALITNMPDTSSGSDSSESGDEAERTMLRVMYTVNCIHNMKNRGHAPPNPALTPKVREDAD